MIIIIILIMIIGLPWEAGEDLQGEDCNMGTDCINLLQGGCKVCDRVLTVSPNYAMEIQSPEGACGMHEILRWKAGAMRLAGILNGIADEWNPSTDKFITTNYSIEDPGRSCGGRSADPRRRARV